MKQKNKTKNKAKQLNLNSFFGKTNPNARLDTETHVNKEVMKEIISLVEKNIANESKFILSGHYPEILGR